MKRMVSVIGLLAVGLVAASFSLSFAEGIVTGRSVHFTPHPARTGEIMKISVRVAVGGAPVKLTASVEQTTPRHVGPPPPTVLLGTFHPGDHLVDVYRYNIPASPPERICFSIKITGGEFRNACLKRGRGVSGWFMDVENYGQWVEAAPAPAPVPSAERPDLRISGNLAVDDLFKIENIGRGTAHNVRAVKECFVEERWVRSGGEFGETRMLGPGESVPVRIGKLGRSLGSCPSGTTKVRVVVDPQNEIAEIDENNNVSEASTLADLRIIKFESYYPIVGVGGTPGYRLNFEISNTGVGDAGSFAWEVSVFRDGEWRSFIGEKIAGLDSGKRVEREKNVGVRVREGERIRLRVDALNEVPETNEEDNIREATVPRKP